MYQLRLGVTQLVILEVFGIFLVENGINHTCIEGTIYAFHLASFSFLL